MAHSFGESSTKQYNTLHPDLKIILDHVISVCEVDFSLLEGYRSPEKQFGYFKQGRKQNSSGEWIVTEPSKVITNVDGYKNVGKHNHYPSTAIDINVYVPDKPELIWDKVHLTYIAANMVRIADQLYKEGKITHKLRWGGNWDGDGDLADNKLYDLPHFELYKL